MNTHAEALFRALADDIVDGRIAPGTRLDEVSLAQRFGVSRTPVREAIRQLATADLVEHRPRRGAVVAKPSAERLSDMFEVMRDLECMAARLSAERMTTIERRRLETLHRDSAAFVRAGDDQGYEAANLAFHAALFAGSHNGVLVETATAMRRRLRPFSRGQFRLLGRLARSFQEHQAIVDAVMRADTDAATAAMARHLEVVGVASADYIAGVRTDTAAAGGL